MKKAELFVTKRGLIFSIVIRASKVISLLHTAPESPEWLFILTHQSIYPLLGNYIPHTSERSALSCQCYNHALNPTFNVQHRGRLGTSQRQVLIVQPESFSAIMLRQVFSPCVDAPGPIQSIDIQTARTSNWRSHDVRDKYIA